MNIISLPLGKSGLFAIIDIEDADLAQYKWYLSRKTTRLRTYTYAVGRIRNDECEYQLTSLHKAITGCPKGSVVDHINHDGLDNRRENLRVVSYIENWHNHLPIHHNDKRYAVSG